MAIDALAYSKALEAAEAHVETLVNHVLPDLVTKADLEAAKIELERAIERLEHRLTLRLIAVVGAFNAALFALLRFVH